MLSGSDLGNFIQLTNEIAVHSQMILGLGFRMYYLFLLPRFKQLIATFRRSEALGLFLTKAQLGLGRSGGMS